MGIAGDLNKSQKYECRVHSCQVITNHIDFTLLDHEPEFCIHPVTEEMLSGAGYSPVPTLISGPVSTYPV
jgi:hypothetical protein